MLSALPVSQFSSAAGKLCRKKVLLVGPSALFVAHQDQLDRVFSVSCAFECEQRVQCHDRAAFAVAGTGAIHPAVVYARCRTAERADLMNGIQVRHEGDPVRIGK